MTDNLVEERSERDCYSRKRSNDGSVVKMRTKCQEVDSCAERVRGNGGAVR